MDALGAMTAMGKEPIRLHCKRIHSKDGAHDQGDSSKIKLVVNESLINFRLRKKGMYYESPLQYFNDLVEYFGIVTDTDYSKKVYPLNHNNSPSSRLLLLQLLEFLQ